MTFLEPVSLTLFKSDENEDAEKMYLEYEKEVTGDAHLVVALVSTIAVGGIKKSYPNYFADSTGIFNISILYYKI